MNPQLKLFKPFKSINIGASGATRIRF